MREVSADELKKLIQGHKKVKNLFDVRTQEEYQNGHIKGAELLDCSSDSFFERVSEMDRRKKYIFYCKTDNRSRQVVKSLEASGFENVWFLKDGYQGWLALSN